MSDIVQLQVIPTRLSNKVDGSWKIEFNTRELEGEDAAHLVDNFRGEGWLVFKRNEIVVADIPEPDADAGQKSQSQRLRDVIYVLFKQRGEPQNDFDQFYRKYLEQLIEYTKGKLTPEEDR